jgi:hypothetical protein
MDKTIFVITVLFLFLAVASAVHAIPAALCSDPDNGKDIWTASITIDNKGANPDDCDGQSQNLKEFYCEGDTIRLDNIKCSDFKAICISAGDESVPDYCGCEKGYIFDTQSNTCIVLNDVPEFGPLAAAIALIGALIAFIFISKE